MANPAPRYSRSTSNTTVLASMAELARLTSDAPTDARRPCPRCKNKGDRKAIPSFTFRTRARPGIIRSEHDIDRSETERDGLLSVEHGTNAIAVAV
mmetsp:Transcript_87136/g.141226  ORF Transcript_87136/g.141226 Transcript_87136/m.141226 type:complete len:96 (-) Transcript_87136:29-316(-)